MVGGLLQGKNKLAQVLNGVNVMMGGGGDGVRAFRDHAGTGDVRPHLGAGQVPADSRLRALTHFDLNGCAGVEVVLVHAEPPACHLHDSVGTVGVEILVETALAGVVVNTQLSGCPCQAFMGIVADGAVAHGGEHHRHGKLQLGGKLTV